MPTVQPSAYRSVSYMMFLVGTTFAGHKLAYVFVSNVTACRIFAYVFVSIVTT